MSSYCAFFVLDPYLAVPKIYIFLWHLLNADKIDISIMLVPTNPSHIEVAENN